MVFFLLFLPVPHSLIQFQYAPFLLTKNAGTDMIKRYIF